ncbi:MAG: FKBP-type peptidyl-prolyl cis-trans isomerase [Flammeovirgaceae bacterium]|nr:MAG: FKBP-type peptidyl-prolyl cis-trans isomerase [Flammeovirgaceae bacterium]
MILSINLIIPIKSNYMRNAIFACCLAALLAGCSENVKETPSGLKYKVIKSGDGVRARVGEILVFDYALTDSKDSVWTSTIDNGFPSAYMVNDSSAIPQENGIIQMLRQLSKGDSVVVDISISEFFKKLSRRPIPENLDSTLMMRYQFRVNEIMNNEKFMTYEQELMNNFLINQLKRDTRKIDAYLNERGIKADTLPSGLRYVITSPGTGETAKSGQTVKVNYTGYLLNGPYFDSSIQSVAEEKNLYDPGRTYGPYEVTIDQSSVIQGWHDALKTMNKGAKGTFYIPSTLAYGPQQRSAVIKPNSILVFELEMVDIAN